MVQSKIGYIVSIITLIMLASCGNSTSLTIVTNPPGATIEIDGTAMEAPALFENIEPGSHSVSASLVGYLPATIGVEVEEGRNNTFSIELSKERPPTDEPIAGLPEEGFRIRTEPNTTKSTCYIIDHQNWVVSDPVYLEETPSAADWNKVAKMAGIDENEKNLSAIIICSDNDGNYGACAVGPGTDAIFKIKPVDWLSSAPNWDFEPEGGALMRAKLLIEAVKSDDGYTLDLGGKTLGQYKGNIEFRGDSISNLSAWSYIDNQGRQTIGYLRKGGEIQVLWEGTWSLGALDHLGSHSRHLSIIDENTIVAAIGSQTGYQVAVFDLKTGEIVAARDVEKFPEYVESLSYNKVHSITCHYSSRGSETFTWFPETGIRGAPTVINGDFSHSAGVWLPAGEDGRIELRIMDYPTVSVCFERGDDNQLYAIWAGVR